MASFTLPDTPFPNGTSVSAYDATGYSNFPAGGPPGSPVATATVTAGSLTFTGLTNHRSYFAAAKVSEAWKNKKFSVGDNGPPPSVKDIDYANVAPGAPLVVNADESGFVFGAGGLRWLDEFAAVGDGVSDDTAAWEEAAAVANASGRALALTPGKTYLISDTIEAWNGAVILGNNATLDIQADQTAEGKRLFLDELEGVRTHNLVLACSNAEERHQNYGLLSIEGGGDHDFYGLEISGGEGTAVWTGAEAERLGFVRPRIKGTKADGIHLSRGTSQVQIIAPIVEETGDDALAVVSYKKDGPTEYTQCTDIEIVSPICRNFSQSNGKGVAIVGAKNVTVIGGEVTGSKEGGYTAAQEEETTYTGEKILFVGCRARDMPEDHGFAVSATDVSLESCVATNCLIGAILTGSTRARVHGGRYKGATGIYENGATEATVRAADLRGNSVVATNAPNTIFYNCDGVTTRQVITAANTIAPKADKDLLVITGDTEVKKITVPTGLEDAHRYFLRFTGIPKVKDGENLKLAGDFEASADDTLELIHDEGNFYEVGRSAN